MSSDYLDYVRKMMRMQGSGVCEEFPVIRRPWGGPNCTTLMIELWPDIFKGGKVIAAIEKGYVSTDDYEPAEWVENCCSGLVYERHAEDDNGFIYIVMHTDENAVKTDSEYAYLISGYGGGEYQVAVLLQKDGKITSLYEESFCCK